MALPATMTDLMHSRAAYVGGTWRNEGDGYYSLQGINRHLSPLVAALVCKYLPPHLHGGVLAYVAIPTTHPDVCRDYNTLEPDVNGGLTFGEGNIFGWDYCHPVNRTDIEGDIQAALSYFKRRAAGAS